MNDGGHNPNAHGGFITADELSYFVKEHIELCIQRCMSLEETEQHIQSNFGIESVVVRRLWRRLEDENQEFFRSYCIRRRLVSVVNRFNDQLERQQELMRETGMLERPNHDAAISGQDQEQEQVQLQLQPQPQPQLILQWLQTQEQVLNQQQQQILQRLQTQTQSHYHQQQTQVLHQPQMPSLGNLPRKEIL
ncbi:PREDICTED: zinc finger protein 853-like isoform X2 [Tarenaya hassleriana]|uniref:zinc finger protein 853-like isoform X2 n=1 Tax=Tarenaya hassleriana TaxID=28532 RepID=UPI0008FCFBA7|nr:PREDICTED: zinc finger protein 853-like isoform X2 [Tarenaya hassleriana]